MNEKTYLVTIVDRTDDPDRDVPSNSDLATLIGQELGEDLGLVSVEVEDAPDKPRGHE